MPQAVHTGGITPDDHHPQSHGVADHSAAVTVQDDGATQGDAKTLNFTGAGVVATVAASTATINIPGGGGGGSSDTLVAWIAL